VDAESVQNTSELMARYGLVEEPVPAAKLLEGAE